VTRLIDRDMRTEQEVQELRDSGLRVLSRRHLEAYLLDDEVISTLCESREQQDKITEALKVKSDELTASIARGNDPDDVKSAAGSIYVGLRKLLGLTAAGQSWDAFARDTLAPLISVDLSVYQELRQDVFG
jgi:hypothetical protein